MIGCKMKQTTKRKLKKLACALLTLCLAASLSISTAMPASAQTKQQQLQSQKEQTQKELEQAKKELENTQAQVNATAAQLKELEQQKSSISAQIGTLQQQISQTQALIDAKAVEIENKQIDIDNKQADIDARWDGLKARMAAMQQLNDGGSLFILSSASNLYELLTFTETLQEIYDKDTEILGEMEAERAELKQQKEDLEAAKAEYENQRAELEVQNNQLQTKQYELAINMKKLDENLTAAEALEQAQQQKVDEAQAAFDKAANEYDSYLKSLIQNTEQNYANAPISCSLNFICPLPSYKYISCYYGSGGHKGVDFAAPGGTTIRSIADGVVITVENHWSYGYYVMVYHGTDDNGNSYTSLYAHMNSWPPVSVGQAVTKGDTIGYVGTTGNSTGNHLHLELRVNGNRTNALNYVPR